MAGGDKIILSMDENKQRQVYMFEREYFIYIFTEFDNNLFIT